MRGISTIISDRHFLRPRNSHFAFNPLYAYGTYRISFGVSSKSIPPSRKLFKVKASANAVHNSKFEVI